jgi:hypothetical protein
MFRIVALMAFVTVAACSLAGQGTERSPSVSVYEIFELTLHGPLQGPQDAPAREIELAVTFRHESGAPEYTVQGFWDGDGRGGDRGDVFKVRFCPTRPGHWTIARTASNRAELKGQREGTTILVTPAQRHGFWEVDRDSPGRRWYRRSDGSHQYVVGN